MKANYEYRFDFWEGGHWEPVYVDLVKDQFYRENSEGWMKSNLSWSWIASHPSGETRPIYSEASDNVNSPSHYNESGIECIEAIRASLGPKGFQAYCKGNCMKYLWRYEYKNGVEDLEKAQVYLGWMIDSMKEN